MNEQTENKPRSINIPAKGSLAGLARMSKEEMEERYGETEQDFRRDAAEDTDRDDPEEAQ